MRILTSLFFLIVYLFSAGNLVQSDTTLSVVKIEITHSHEHLHDEVHKHHHSDKKHNDEKDEVPHSHEFSLGSPVIAIVAPQFVLKNSSLVLESARVLSAEAPLAPDRSTIFRPPIS